MSSRFSPHRILEIPAIYRLAQFLLAPGFREPFVNEIRAVSASLPRGELHLDVACGPVSWTWEIGLNPVGLDLLPSYTSAFNRSGAPAVTGSATDLPFPDGSFDGVWCFSLLHHLPDDAARTAIREMVRVCRPSGYVVIWDIVLPERPLRRPIAWTIRRLDRGGRVRSREHLKTLLGEAETWNFRHLRYTLYGLEGIFCVLTQQDRQHST